MRRGLTIAMIGIVLLFCAAIIVVYVSIGSVITSSVEKYGSAMTQTSVTLTEAEFSPTTGEATLLNLKVESPVPFTAQPALLAPRIEIQIDPHTIGQETIVIKRLMVEAPEITYEIIKSGDNLRKIRDHIKDAVSAEQRGQFPLDRKGSPKKIIIDDLYIQNGVVIVQAENLTGNRETALLEDIHLENVGQAENGLEAAALIEEIYASVLQATTLAALSTDLNLSDQMRNILRGASDETEELVNHLRNLLEK
ncbi:hypothetical protein [uncultured Sneathiella sp.]|uniref:hypothetical protein n=1 Tax=uncultured Sneathiella sp. TaxID=879315 RepID=UPI0030DD2097